MRRSYFKKARRRLILLLSQLSQFPRDLTRQISIFGSRSLAQSEAETPLRVLVIVHAYWPQQFRFIINNLNQIKMPLAIVVTIPEGAHTIQIEDLLLEFSKHHDVSTIRVENAGRDIGPFLIAIESFANRNWDLVIKLHTKASQNAWFESLVRSLIRNDRRIQNHLKLLKKYPDGIIVHPYFRYPGHKQSLAEPAMQRLLQVLISRNYPIREKWYFAAGSMFAVAPAMLLDVVRDSKDIGLSIFEREREYSQASTAHAIERFIGISASAKGCGLLCSSIVDYLDFKALSVKLI